MIANILTLINGACLLSFGISLTAAFAGLRHSKGNCLVFLGLFFFSGGLQLVATLTFSEAVVWKLYPFITHLPLILILCIGYRKSLATAAAATFTAYMCCQPSKWFGVLIFQIAQNTPAELIARILFLIPVSYIAIVHASSSISEIFNKDQRSVYIFGIVPTVYYLYDYITVVYTNLLHTYNRVAMEILPLFLVIVYMIFCFVYYKEYEQRADAQRKEQIIRIAVEQQGNEITALKQSEQEVRLLRHDMRLFLSNLAVLLENGETEKVRELIAPYITSIDRTRLERFCDNDTVNYVLSNYAARCKNEEIPLSYTIKLEELNVDEIMFSSILSNALDNAINAQKLLSPDKRCIKLMLQTSGEKLLLSVKNPAGQKIIFTDGLPISSKKGHGYGTQSIRYMTERLGGNCQFSVQDGLFILRVVL